MGRLAPQRRLPFGVDPFVYTATIPTSPITPGCIGVLIVWLLYQLPDIGGASWWSSRRCLIAALAGILMRTGRRRGQSLWIPAACTALAILAVSPRLFLQSTCLSFFFLGLTLWLLVSAGQDGKRLWLSAAAVRLWVNCDAWFILGPLTLALYLVGGLLANRCLPARPLGHPFAGKECR